MPKNNHQDQITSQEESDDIENDHVAKKKGYFRKIKRARQQQICRVRRKPMKISDKNESFEQLANSVYIHRKPKGIM